MEFGPGAFQSGLYGVDSAGEVVRLALMLIAMGALIHVAARMVVRKSTPFQAMAASMLAFLAFYLVLHLVRVWAVAFIMGAVAFAAVIGLVYKTKEWSKGASIGALAWVMFYMGGVLLNWAVTVLRA